jgi:hypothetical protein
VRRAVNPWHPGVEERLVLTRVEVPPDALLRVIATGQLLRAVRARPASVRMLCPQIHPFARRIQCHAADAPRRLNLQNRFEDFVSCTDDPLAVGSITRWLARQQAPACWPSTLQAASATRGPGAPKAPRIARKTLDAAARSWHVSVRLPTENPGGLFFQVPTGPRRRSAVRIRAVQN